MVGPSIHSVSVAGIVVDDQDRVLVVQRRDNGKWEPPGGVLELAETPQEGVRREVHEETGFEVSVGNLSGVYKNLPRGVVALVFRCTVLRGSAEASDETAAVQWKTRTEVQQLMDQAYAVRVEDAFEGSVQVRSHNGVSVLSERADTVQ